MHWASKDCQKVRTQSANALLVHPLSRQQLNAELSNDQRKHAKTQHGDAHTGQHGEPEPQARQQQGEGEEHGQGRYHEPERVPGMVGNFLQRLFFHIKPDQRKEGHQRQRRDKPAELVTALCCL